MLRELGLLLKVAATEWWNDNSFRLSAALAFYTIFSMAPILIIAVGVSSAIFGEQAASRQLLREIESLVGPDGARAVADVMASTPPAGQTPAAIALGLLMVAIGSTAVFVELQSALNLIWDVRADPSRGVLGDLIRERLWSFAIVLGVGFLLLVSLVVSALLAGAQEHFQGRAEDLSLLWTALNGITSFSVTTLLFAMIYKYLPDVRLRWRDVIVGALVTSVLFTVGKHFIGLYLGQLAFASRYGAAGSLAVLLLWVYYSALICFFGAEFTAAYMRHVKSKIPAEPHAVRVGHKPTQV